MTRAEGIYLDHKDFCDHRSYFREPGSVVQRKDNVMIVFLICTFFLTL